MAEPARPRLWVSLYAGSCPEVLYLLAGAQVRPPVAYMGSKVSLAHVIVGAMGLGPGVGADAVLLCDGGPWGWVWQALLDPEVCRDVAVRLRSWREEDPVELWKRLAAQPPPGDVVDRAATVLWLQGRALGSTPVWWEPARGRWEMDGHGRATERRVPAVQRQHELPAREDGRWVMAEGASRGGGAGDIEQRSNKPASGRGLRDPGTVAKRVEVIADVVARYLALQAFTVQNRPLWHDGTRWVNGRGDVADGGPEAARVRSDVGSRGLTSTAPIARRVEGIADTVARWVVLQAGNAHARPVDVVDGRWSTNGYAHLSESARERGFNDRVNTEQLAARIDRIAEVPRRTIHAHHGDVIGVVLWLLVALRDLRGVYVYMDPPYAGRTAYAMDCSRARVIAIARALSDAGAVVAVSEAVPLAGELGDGWHELDITAGRRGRTPLTFRKGGDEWLTLNRPPAVNVARQLPLLAPGAA